MRTPAEELGLFFRRARESQNLSQEDLADLTRRHPGQVSRAMISAVERGRHLPGLEVLLTLSQALHISPAEVLERLELTRGQRVEAEGLTLEQLDRKASRAFWNGDVRSAAGYYEAMLHALQSSNHEDPEYVRRTTATTELRRGAALRRCGATTAARASIERAISMADGIPEIQSQAYIVLVALLIQLGRLPLARDAATRAVALTEGLEDPKIKGWAWIEKGEVLHASGRFLDAREAFVEARKWARRAKDTEHLIKIEGNIGACLRDAGHRDAGRRHYLEAVKLSRKNESPATEAIWLVELGQMAREDDQLERADRYAREAVQISKPREDLLTCFRAEWLRHLVHLARTPDERDRHRIAYLKKLYVRLQEHHGVAEIREFKRIYCSASSAGGGA